MPPADPIEARSSKCSGSIDESCELRIMENKLVSEDCYITVRIQRSEDGCNEPSMKKDT